MNIAFIDSLPDSFSEIGDFLKNKGFTSKIEDTADCVRWCYYRREIKKSSSNVMFRIVLRFELCISDDPFASYDDNCDLSFDEAYLVVSDRRMDSEPALYYGETMCDEDTESIRNIDKFEINPTTFSDIEILISMLE